MELSESKTHWDSTEHPPYMGVYHPICGWKAVLYVWVTYGGNEQGMYEPWQTGMCGHATREGAVREATSWAEDEEVILRV